jgi:hypothetical protein
MTNVNIRKNHDGFRVRIGAGSAALPVSLNDFNGGKVILFMIKQVRTSNDEEFVSGAGPRRFHF